MQHEITNSPVLPFPADSAEYEEYSRVMNELADIAQESAPDPQPSDFGGICEDAPCCGCCGPQPFHETLEREYDPDIDDNYNWRDEYDGDVYHEDGYDNGMEDRYLDASWEDRFEMDMGDF